MDLYECGFSYGVRSTVDMEAAVQAALAQAISAHQLRYPGVWSAMAEIGSCVGGVVKAAAKAVGGAVLSVRSPTVVEAGLAVALVGVGARSLAPAIKDRVRDWRKPVKPKEEDKEEELPIIPAPPEVAELLRPGPVLESVMAGSEFLVMERPGHQAALGVHEWDGKSGRLGFKVFGGACLVKWTMESPVGPPQYWLITHEHTFVHSTHLVGHYRWPEEHKIPALRGTLASIDLRALKPIPFHRDHLALELTSSQVSQLGLSPVRRIAPLDKRTSVSIVGPTGQGTVGDADLLPEGPIGQMMYTGSTTGGFSGSTYMSGSAVYGIHQSGGARNTGYTLSYLLKKLFLELGVTKEARARRVAVYVGNHPVYTPPNIAGEGIPEASDDYFRALYLDKVPIKWESWGVDEVMVEIRGRTTIHDVDTLRSKFGRSWAENLAKPPAQRHARDFDDIVHECAVEPVPMPAGECKSPGASSSVASSQGESLVEVVDLIKRFTKLSLASQALFLTRCAESTTSSSSPVRQGQENIQA